MDVVSLQQAAAALTEYWSPQVVGRINDQYVKVAKVKGQLTWHKHAEEDEMFLVLDGRLTIEYEDGSVVLHPGEFHIVPRDTMHNPVCDEECLIALIEPVGTQHTGETIIESTRTVEQQLKGFQS